VSFAYFLDYRTGGPVEGTDGLAGARLGEYLATAPSVIRLVDGTIRELIRTDAPGTLSKPVPTEPTGLLIPAGYPGGNWMPSSRRQQRTGRAAKAADLLSAHVRFEERELFEVAQQRLAPQA
jgi:hypothetical protein